MKSKFPELSDVQPLASGGQKEVFAAIHADDGEVVVKLMHPGSNPDRVERELAAPLKVQAPRVPLIFAHGQLQGNTGAIPWIREQRILGVPLNDKILTGGLTYPELLRLALHVSETLVAAEKVKIVHRDVKPANIIMDSGGGFWLIDFGVARHLDLDPLTATAAPGGYGTMGYAPSEQCRNDQPEIDARADLFALGVTLYEAATTCNPHVNGARDRFDVLARVTSQRLPRLCNAFPPEFADLVATLAQPCLVHRCQSAHEAYVWIQELCDREGVQ